MWYTSNENLKVGNHRILLDDPVQNVFGGLQDKF